MSFLSGLSRAWVTVEVPGTSPQRVPTTYVSYPSDALPAVPIDVASLEWLRQAAPHPEDYLATAFESATRDLSAESVPEVLGGRAPLPRDLAGFIEDGLRDRLRSATDCYFDLGDSAVEVEGGRLLHLVSDSQWVYHWLLYVGDDGHSAVLGTNHPAGFALAPDDIAMWQVEGWDYVVVADSFAEFVWRWWMDNEVFYRVAVDEEPLTESQRAYVEQYGPPQRLG